MCVLSSSLSTLPKCARTSMLCRPSWPASNRASMVDSPTVRLYDEKACSGELERERSVRAPCCLIKLHPHPLQNAAASWCRLRVTLNLLVFTVACWGALKAWIEQFIGFRPAMYVCWRRGLLVRFTEGDGRAGLEAGWLGAGGGGLGVWIWWGAGLEGKGVRGIGGDEIGGGGGNGGLGLRGL